MIKPEMPLATVENRPRDWASRDERTDASIWKRCPNYFDQNWITLGARIPCAKLDQSTTTTV